MSKIDGRDHAPGADDIDDEIVDDAMRRALARWKRHSDAAEQFAAEIGRSHHRRQQGG